MFGLHRSTVAIIVVSLCCLIGHCGSSFELELYRNSTNHSTMDLTYTLPLVVDKQHFKFKVTLNDADSWVKGAECHLCNGVDCKDKCTKVLSGSAGFKCHSKKTCQRLTQGLKEDEFQGEVDGDMYKAPVMGEQHQPIGSTDLLVARTVQEELAETLGKNFDGEINLLSQATMFGGYTKFSLLYPEKAPLLVLGDLPPKYLVDPEQILATELRDEGSLVVDEVGLDGKMLTLNGRAILSTEDKQLLVSRKVYQHLAAVLTESLKNCSVSTNNSHSITIQCKEEAQKQYELLNGKHLTLVFNQTKVVLPLHSLIANCKKDSCSTFIRVLPKDSLNELVLGEVLLTTFAVTFDFSAQTVRFSRLNNLWGKMYTEAQSFGILHKLWWSIGLLFRIIFYMSLVSVVINMYFNRKKIFKWFGRRVQSGKTDRQKESSLAYSATLSDDIDRPVLPDTHRIQPSNDYWQPVKVEGI